jgi:hypothetical protein
MTTSTPDVDDPEAFNHRFAEVSGIRTVTMAGCCW